MPSLATTDASATATPAIPPAQTPSATPVPPAPSSAPIAAPQTFYAAFADDPDAPSPGLLEVIFEVPSTPPPQYLTVQQMNQDPTVTYLTGTITNSLAGARQGWSDILDTMTRITVEAPAQRCEFRVDDMGQGVVDSWEPVMDGERLSIPSGVEDKEGKPVDQETFQAYRAAWEELLKLHANPAGGNKTATSPGQSADFVLTSDCLLTHGITDVWVEGSRGTTHAVPVEHKGQYLPSNHPG